eukprot:TRINITY_DN2743_c0_g1_i12.p1 TRINITY_DN2743_c0_g1~~TRINITY_DN2743_c0_g1_i12.p1  ORF type:complete len:681 (+),score=87.87 TRINITY_DN2743_c0_g1_i12:179-2221(+)
MMICNQTSFGAFVLLIILQGLLCFGEWQDGRKLLQSGLPVCDQIPCLASQLPPTPLNKQSVLQFTEFAANLKILSQIIASDLLNADLQTQLQDPDLAAVFFAPSDDAFALFFESRGITKAEFLEDGDLLNDVVKLHFVQNTSFVKALYESQDGTDFVVDTLLDSQQVSLKLGQFKVEKQLFDVVEILGPANIDYVISPAKFQLSKEVVLNSPKATSVFILTEVLQLPKKEICNQVPCGSQQIGSIVIDVRQSVYQFIKQFSNLQIATRIMESPALNDEVSAAFRRSDFVAIIMLPTDAQFEQYFEKINVTEEAFLRDRALIDQFIGIHIIPFTDITYPDSEQVSSFRTLQAGITMNLRVGADGNLQASVVPDAEEWANVVAEIKIDPLQLWILDQVLETVQPSMSVPSPTPPITVPITIAPRPEPAPTSEVKRTPVPEAEPTPATPMSSQSSGKKTSGSSKIQAIDACENITQALDLIEFTSQFNQLIKMGTIGEEISNIVINEDQQVVMLVPDDNAMNEFFQYTSKEEFLQDQDAVDAVLEDHLILFGEEVNVLQEEMQTMSLKNVSFVYNAVSLQQVSIPEIGLQATVSAVVSPCPNKSYAIFIDKVLSKRKGRECDPKVKAQLDANLMFIPDCVSMSAEQLICLKDQCADFIQQDPALQCDCTFNGLKCSQECYANE